MRYVLEDRISPNGFLYCMLHEMSDAELRDAEAMADPNQKFVPVTWERAHRWVLSGGEHQTCLYVDDIGRVRRARD